MSKIISLIIRYCGLFGIILGVGTFVYGLSDAVDAYSYNEGAIFFPFIFSSAIVFGGLVVLAIGEILATLLRIEETLKKEEVK